jgi:hypothetical protein
MPLVRLIAEGVGPFQKLDLDLSDGHGNPHLGPHILAGVNGSGKSTVLRTIAWVMDRGVCGFPYDEWEEMLRGHKRSTAVAATIAGAYGNIASSLPKFSELQRWAASCGLDAPISADVMTAPGGQWSPPPKIDFPNPGHAGSRFSYAAYTPSRALRHVPLLDLTRRLKDGFENCLAFESTVQNEATQAWLVGQYSNAAIARDQKKSDEPYERALRKFREALKSVYGGEITLDVVLDSFSPQPSLKFKGRSLNFSQLPDGVRSTVGWIADFMMRQDRVDWDPALKGKRPGFLLLDEPDMYLHPKWQRTLLPALRKALPEIQIIVASHSPFIISSCQGARIHILDVDEHGNATARPPMDAPIGKSVMATLTDIFGIRSEFDVETERELDEWNKLKRLGEVGPLPAKDKARLRELTITLSDRSEELCSLVAAPVTIAPSVVDSLLRTPPRPKPARRKRA